MYVLFPWLDIIIAVLLSTKLNLHMSFANRSITAILWGKWFCTFNRNLIYSTLLWPSNSANAQAIHVFLCRLCKQSDISPLTSFITSPIGLFCQLCIVPLQCSSRLFPQWWAVCHWEILYFMCILVVYLTRPPPPSPHLWDVLSYLYIKEVRMGGRSTVG